MDWTDLGPKLRDIALREGWTFHPPVDEATLVEFESTHGISFPEPYRQFLLEVTGGIETDCMQLCPSEGGEDELQGSLAEPFPYTTTYGDKLLAAGLVNRFGHRSRRGVQSNVPSAG